MDENTHQFLTNYLTLWKVKIKVKVNVKYRSFRLLYTIMDPIYFQTKVLLPNECIVDNAGFLWMYTTTTASDNTKGITNLKPYFILLKQKDYLFSRGL